MTRLRKLKAHTIDAFVASYRKEWKTDSAKAVAYHLRIMVVGALFMVFSLRMSIWEGEWFWSVVSAGVLVAFLIVIWLDYDAWKDKVK